MGISSLLSSAAAQLARSGSPSSRLDAELLLMHQLQKDRVYLLTHPQQEIQYEQYTEFARLLERRKAGEPVSYIIGEKEFWSLSFEVGRAVLIPRPETECLIEEALRYCPFAGAGMCLGDIGTGSGAIAVVLAKELPSARIVATDSSPAALAVARRNAARHGVAERIDFYLADILSGVPGDFDLLCSNPPYIKEGDYAALPAGIREFEPPEALLAGPDGLAAYRKIIPEGRRLKSGGRIIFEIGENQQEEVGQLLKNERVYEDISCLKDYGGADRILSARRR